MRSKWILLGVLLVGVGFGIFLSRIKVETTSYLGSDLIANASQLRWSPTALPGESVLEFRIPDLGENQRYQLSADLKTFRKVEFYLRDARGNESKRLGIWPKHGMQNYSGVFKTEKAMIDGRLHIQIYRGDWAEVDLQKVQIRPLDRAYYWKRDLFRWASWAGWTVALVALIQFACRREKKPGTESQTSKDRFERYAFAILFVGLLLLLLAIDGLMGWILVPKFPGICSDEYHHGLKANYHGMDTWGGAQFEIKTNSLGMRSAQVGVVPLLSEKRRLAFIGDSFTHGKGLAYENTWPGMVAQEFQGSDLEIFNAGVSSYSPHLYDFRIKSLLEDQGFRFQELVVAVDLSDIEDELVYQEVRGVVDRAWFSQLKKRIEYYWNRESFVGYFFPKISWERWKIGNSSQIATEVSTPVGIMYHVPNSSKAEWQEYFDLWPDEKSFYLERGEWTRNPEIEQRWGNLGKQLAIYYMDQLVKRCEKQGIRVSVMVYPWKQQIRDRRLDCPNVLLWKKFCEERRLKFINLYPDFINAGTPETVCDRYFIDGDVHWNAEGNRLVADGVLREMKAQGIGK